MDLVKIALELVGFGFPATCPLLIFFFPNTCSLSLALQLHCAQKGLPLHASTFGFAISMLIRLLHAQAILTGLLWSFFWLLYVRPPLILWSSLFVRKLLWPAFSGILWLFRVHSPLVSQYSLTSILWSFFWLLSVRLPLVNYRMTLQNLVCKLDMCDIIAPTWQASIIILLVYYLISWNDIIRILIK